jgi:hypothetical protein
MSFKAPPSDIMVRRGNRRLVPEGDITRAAGQRALRGNIRFSQSLDTAALEVT